MVSRFLAGAKGLRWALAVASLVLASITGTMAAPKVQTAKPSATGLSAGVDHGPEATMKRPQLFPRSNYVWPYATGPVYGEVDSSRWNEPGIVHTRVGSFDLTRGLPALPPQLRAENRLGQIGMQYFLFQMEPEAFGNGAFDRVKSSIESTGGAIVQDVPVGAFVARLTQAGLSAIDGDPEIVGLVPYQPAFKLSPTIGRAPLPDPVKAVSDVYTLDAQIFAGENADAVAQALAALGANVIANYGDVIRFEIHRSKLPEVAAIQAIGGVNEYLPVFLDGEESAGTVQSGVSKDTTPYNDAGILGTGQLLMVLDSGIQLDAGDLSNTRTDPGTAGPAHRKVESYTTTAPFGGAGDLLGCDASTSGGFTHGHVVSSSALGNATRVDTGTYGAGWLKTTGGNDWDFDGVAPRARLVMYDAEANTSQVGCGDPLQGGLSVGNIYTRGQVGNAAGSLANGYSLGARIMNFSWGASAPGTYGTNAGKIDQFLFDNDQAMVFVSAGNDGADNNNDNFPDLMTTSDPATARNSISVGACGVGAGAQFRAFFSSTGPTSANATARVTPLVMAPGQDGEGIGFANEFACKSNDNDQLGSPLCDTSQGANGTSFSSPVAAGSGLLVRSYLAQGFYPDGTDTNPGNASDMISNISGAMVKALLVNSAEFLTITQGNTTIGYRFNNEQGYGRILLSNTLPLTTYPTPIGLIICDGGTAGGRCDTGSVNGSIATGNTQTYTLKVVDNNQPLRISLAWVEDPGGAPSEGLIRDLDLELQAPSGRIYYGNFFTDDENRNGILDAGENCDYDGTFAYPRNSTNKVDNSAWSIPKCAASDVGGRDTKNPTEAVMISPDPIGDGIADNPSTGPNEGVDNMIEVGDYTLRVIARTFTGSQKYALAISGPVLLGSSARIERVRPDGNLASGDFVCNDKARITVNEIDEPGTDPAAGLTPAEIGGRTVVQVWNPGPNGTFDGGTGDDVLYDSETNLTFTDLDGAGAGLKFQTGNVVLTDGTVGDPGNGALDVKSGYTIVVTYNDETSNVADPNKKRISTSALHCTPLISQGGVIWPQFGVDTFTLIEGGCERDARGFFTFGFPDRYIDAGELIGYRIAFLSSDAEDIEDVTLTLKAVDVDGDSPLDCVPGTTNCADPNRLNNPISSLITVLDSPKRGGRLLAGAAMSANFTLQVASSITGTPEIEMVLGVSAQKSGRAVESYAVSRHTLDVDETSFFYSTDFPGGGVETRDWDSNESIQNPTTNTGDFLGDYRFETRTWSPLNINGKNGSISAPWNFDTNRGNFTSGLNLNTSPILVTGNAPIAQWGEDRDFDDTLDPGEDRDIAGNGILDRGWSTLGGCGWQTNSGNPTGGVWHTGRIGNTTDATCNGPTTSLGRCQQMDVLSGTTGATFWWEVLQTPIVEKVHTCVTGAETDCLGRTDQTGNPVFQVEFLNFEWNQEIDLPDSWGYLAWTVDTDTDSSEQVDMITDNGVLNFISGAVGAVTGGNGPLIDGFSLFAPISACTDAPDGQKRCGGLLTGAVCTNDTPCTGLSINGTSPAVGSNRSGVNNCFFEGKINSSTAKAQVPFGLSRPKDDDSVGGWCERSDVLNGIDRSKFCDSNAQCTGGAPFTGTCNHDADATVDNYVTANGPIRNMDLEKANGPDMRFDTLEDFYGDSGTHFAASFAILNAESYSSTAAVGGFGVAVDDAVMSWREIRKDKDSTTCDAGTFKCAALELNTSNFFEGNSRVELSLVDSTPWDPVNVKNDCNGNGVFTDPGDDTDCNDNGIEDVTVKLTSDVELSPGEIAVLDRQGVGSPSWRGSLPISVNYNSPGVLFLQQRGTDNPTIVAEYRDRNDGSGGACQNDPNPDLRGLIQVTTTVFPPTGRMSLKSIRLTDNGDNDGYPDTNETVSVFVTLVNTSGVNADNVRATLATTSSLVQCISQPETTFGSMLDKEAKESLTPFVFRVSPSVNRTDVNADLKALFSLTARSDQFDALTRPLTFLLEFDLNATGGGTTSAFLEDFEAGTTFTATKFTTQSLDLGIATNALSNGYRCQYNDPDFINSNSFGRVNCFLGFATASSNGYDWHVHTGSVVQSGEPRAYTGTRSLHWGFHQFSLGPGFDSTRFSQLDAVRTNDTSIINLPAAQASSPELTFAHQVSLTDWRFVNAPVGEAADRGAVQVRFVNAAGAAFGNWIKIYPYENQYETQGTDNFSNCIFDPIDDGNTEDDYFDPTDPLRRLGPSTTCFPEFIFSNQGDTNHLLTTTDVSSIGGAEGPGFKGASLGTPAVARGVWVRPKFSLLEFKGRRLQLRFVATSIEVGGGVFTYQLFQTANISGDDGWYIDDIRVEQALNTPVTLSADSAANGGLPGCPSCTDITAMLSANPSSTAAPGQPVEVDASLSSADACPSGTLQYQYWLCANNNTVVGDGGDVMVRDWTDNAMYIDAPGAGTVRYGVKVRCSSALSCDTTTNSATTDVTVSCPSTGNAKTPFNGSVGFASKTSISWTTSQTYDAVKGDLSTLRSSAGNFTTSLSSCLANDQTGTSVADAASPSVGGGFFYLLRPVGAGACNGGPTYSSGAATEASGRDTEIAASGNACP